MDFLVSPLSKVTFLVYCRTGAEDYADVCESKPTRTYKDSGQD